MPGPESVVVRALWEEFLVDDGRAGGLKTLLSRPTLRRSPQTAWALQDVSLDVRSGEVLGLVGANGAGKTTLLRCISGILPPTQGEVLVRGRVVSLLELELALHPELTGLENAIVVSALLGAPRAELLPRLDEVAAFGDLQGMLDREVRTYSSGMRTRLAFSLGLHLDPQVLVVDEYLRGADEEFRRRCQARIHALRSRGSAAIVVSHERPVLEALCDRCLLLERGRVQAEGATGQVFDAYLGVRSSTKRRELTGAG